MPIREYECPDKHERIERIELKQHKASRPFLTCSTCSKVLHSIMSTPAVVRIAGEGVSNPRGIKSERIAEPVWRDTVTGKVTSMY